MEFDELSKAQKELVVKGAQFRYDILKEEMHKRGIPHQEWADLNDGQQEAWMEFFWRLLDLED